MNRLKCLEFYLNEYNNFIIEFKKKTDELQYTCIANVREKYVINFIKAVYVQYFLFKNQQQNV